MKPNILHRIPTPKMATRKRGTFITKVLWSYDAYDMTFGYRWRRQHKRLGLPHSERGVLFGGALEDI